MATNPPYSSDLEYGRSITSPHTHPNLYSPANPQNASNTSLNFSAGIGAALSSNASSIHGDPDGAPGMDDTWGPSHPCYPHLNPHVPTNSPEYASTRIIRIRRDWMLEGDLAPTFSYMYPEILADAGLGEGEFRRVIEVVNQELVPAFNPYNWRNILDAVLGLATGWIWDDMGFTAAKSRLKTVEAALETWNQRLQKENGAAAKFVPLRRSAYMTLDIQIPTPQIGEVEEEGDERTPVSERETGRSEGGRGYSAPGSSKGGSRGNDA